MPPVVQSDLEEVWRARLELARQAFLTSTGDAATATRREYECILAVFTEFVLWGKPLPTVSSVKFTHQ